MQLTVSERNRINILMRIKHLSPADVTRRINAARDRRQQPHVHLSTIFRFAHGRTHVLGATEARGRKRLLTPGDIRTLDRARYRLIRIAKNNHMVTHAMIREEAGLDRTVSLRTCADALRGLGVKLRPPRHKIGITEKDAKVRYKMAREWSKHRRGFWWKSVHAYVDNKAFPMPLTAAQRQKFRQTMITGHLRKASEGLDTWFTKPRHNHSFLGLPSVAISAAVAKDRVIMWHVVQGRWNGGAAATMYQGHLRPALIRTWGRRSKFTVVEDGDRKGNQSGKGLRAKASARIIAMTLPPRTPSLMPLDYAIWRQIMKDLDRCAPSTRESKTDFLKRLRGVARGLPKGFIRSTIARMHEKVHALVQSKGYTPKND